MNKKYSLFLAASLITNNAAAQSSDCVVQPTCLELGYSQTIAQCLEKNLPYIRCPFDMSAVFCGKAAAEQAEQPKPHVGDLKYSIYSPNHDGWLRCDGTQYKQTDYPELYKLIGTKFCHKYTSRTDISYTSNNCNSGYFAVPDYRGFFLRGLLYSNYSAIDYKASRYSNALFYKGDWEGSTGSAASTTWTPQYEELPNINGSLGAMGAVAWQNPSGVFSLSSGGAPQASSNPDAWGLTVLNFNAGNSSPIYSGTHVSPAYYSAYIFIYAGE